MKVMKFRRALICTAAILAILGCSGEDGQGPAPVATATPTPSPTPTPTPTPTPAAAAPFGLTQNADIGTLGLLLSPGTNSATLQWLSPGELQMSWQASLNTFSMNIPPYGFGSLVDDPNQAAPAARFLVDAQARRLAKVNVFVPAGVVGASNYILTGFWAPLENDSFPDATTGAFHFFTAESVRTPPASGVVNYQLGPDPDIKSRLSFDFAAGTVTGEVPLTWTDSWGPYPEARYTVRGGHYDRATGHFSGVFDIPGSGFSGEFRGQVVGPTGQAIAIVIRGATFNPYDQKWVADYSLDSHLRE